MNALKDGSGLFFDDVSDGLSFADRRHTVDLVGAACHRWSSARMVAALAYALRRSWPMVVFAGDRPRCFILNQGYWNETRSRRW